MNIKLIWVVTYFYTKYEYCVHYTILIIHHYNLPVYTSYILINHESKFPSMICFSLSLKETNHIKQNFGTTDLFLNKCNIHIEPFSRTDTLILILAPRGPDLEVFRHLAV